MKLEQILWCVRRARTMENGELRARLAAALDGAADYVRWRVSGKSRFRRGLDHRPFRFCWSPEPLLPELAWNFGPTEAEIAALLDGVHHALGFPWRWEPGRDAWHRAPDTGRVWHETFSHRIDYRPGNPTGDARVMWEPNRLQHLVDLALLANLAPARAAEAIAQLKRQLLSWRAANPVRIGVNYTSAMECALRILSVCFASDLARPRLLGDDAYWSAAATLVVEHAEFVDAHLSLFSSLGNHTVAECVGLLVASLLFPELPRAGAWEKRARRVLEQAAGREITADGGAAEQALHYHAQVLDHLEIAVRVGRHFGRDMAPLDALHRRGAAFLAHFHAGRSRLPSIGDDDGGHALSRHFAPSWAGRAARAASAPSNAMLTLRSGGGYSIVRCDGAELILDHGPLGMAPNFGHGHADALSLQLRIGGEPVLIDPGTGIYGGDAGWRSYFRSTAAHNTVSVDGRSQAKEAGPFLWAEPYACELLRAELVPDRSAIIVARHDGYRSLGILHVRAVSVGPGFVVVLDRLEGAGVHEFVLRWHFAGPARERDGAYALERFPDFRCAAVGGQACLLAGHEAPPAGWQSDRYGTRRPVATLELRSAGPAPHEFITGLALAAHEGGDAARRDAEARRLRDLLDRLIRVGARAQGEARAPRPARAAATAR